MSFKTMNHIVFMLSRVVNCLSTQWGCDRQHQISSITFPRSGFNSNLIVSRLHEHHFHFSMVTLWVPLFANFFSTIYFVWNHMLVCVKFSKWKLGLNLCNPNQPRGVPFQPHHEKIFLCHMRTTKPQISLRICAVWSAPLLFAAKIVKYL